MSKKTVGILRTGYMGGKLAEDHGEFPDMFIDMLGADSFNYRTYSVVDGELPNSIDDCDAWIITGSKHGAYEDHTWIAPLEAFIRKLAVGEQPTVGICFGHQIMAQALGGKVEKFDGGWGIGPQVYKEVETGKTATLLAFHQDQVTECPPGAEITHTSEFCTIAGLRYSSTCWSLQPHPEHTPAFTRDLINQRRGQLLPEETAIAALNKLPEKNDQNAYGTRIKNALNQE